MAQYVVRAPDGKSVTVATPYGNQSFDHDSYMYFDPLAAMYPHIFVKSPIQPGQESTIQQKVEEPKVVEPKKETQAKVSKAKPKGLPTKKSVKKG